MGMAAPLYYTADMVQALPADGNKYETVYGELLVTPAARMWHQVVIQRLFQIIDPYAQQHDLGKTFCLPADISWGDDVLVQPDLFVADSEQVRALDWSKVKTMKLVAEVVSPSSTRYDRFTKRKLYQTVGVQTYCVVDPDRHEAEVWTPDSITPQVHRDRLVWAPPESTKPLAIDLGDLFRPI